MRTAAHLDRVLRIAFVVAAVGWALALPVAAAVSATPHGARGEYALAALAYAIGGMVCHQQGARSFHLWGAQLPVCARCTGIYVGAALAGIVAGARRLDAGASSRPERAVLLWSMLPVALTLAFEWTTGITPSNLIRALSGAPLGAAVAWVAAMRPAGAPARQ